MFNNFKEKLEILFNPISKEINQIESILDENLNENKREKYSPDELQGLYEKIKEKTNNYLSNDENSFIIENNNIKSEYYMVDYPQMYLKTLCYSNKEENLTYSIEINEEIELYTITFLIIDKSDSENELKTSLELFLNEFNGSLSITGFYCDDKNGRQFLDLSNDFLDLLINENYLTEVKEAELLDVLDLQFDIKANYEYQKIIKVLYSFNQIINPENTKKTKLKIDTIK